MRASQIVLFATLVIWESNSVWPQEPDRLWRFGGAEGHAWPDLVELNVLADDVSVPGALQPRELRPGENLLPLLHDVIPFSFWQAPPDPLWLDGMPRLWQQYQTFGPSAAILAKYVDGDLGTFNFWTRPGGARPILQSYTIDVGAQVPLERFVLRTPPGSDSFGEPWDNYIPQHGELSASRRGEQLPTEGVDNQRQYHALDIALGSVQENLETPIEIRFPLQYLRFCGFR